MLVHMCKSAQHCYPEGRYQHLHRENLKFHKYLLIPDLHSLNLYEDLPSSSYQISQLSINNPATYLGSPGLNIGPGCLF
jgi:hypothetical protein